MIPNVVHYVYLKKRPWNLHHFLSVKSALVKGKVEKVNIWLDEEPDGKWWEKTKPLVNLHFIVPPKEIFNIPITQPAHQSDVIRLQVLIEEGGIYVDTDVIFKRPFTDLLHNKFVMGQQGYLGNEGLCPATILSIPDSTFAKEWLLGFKDTFQGGPPGSPTWCTHSVQLPLLLSKKIPDEIVILDHRAFFYPLYHQSHMEMIFEQSHNFSNAYSHHLWESSGKSYLDKMSIEKIRQEDTTFTKLVKDLI